MYFVDTEKSADPVNVLVYGEPGCGKTRFVASIGEVLETALGDTENGLRTLRVCPPIWRKKLTPFRLDSFNDLDKLYKLLQKNDPAEITKALFSREQIEAGKGLTKPIEALAIDTWTSMNFMIKEQRRTDIGDKLTGRGLSKFRDIFEIKDWNMVLDFNEMCIRAFCDLPITFVCTFHEKFYENDKSNIVKGIPSMNGQFAAEVGKYFDVVGHMGIDIQKNYIMDLAAQKKFQGKTRLDLPKQLVNPIFGDIWKAAQRR